MTDWLDQYAALVRVHLHGNEFTLKTVPVGEATTPSAEGGSNG